MIFAVNDFTFADKILKNNQERAKAVAEICKRTEAITAKINQKSDYETLERCKTNMVMENNAKNSQLRNDELFSSGKLREELKEKSETIGTLTSKLNFTQDSLKLCEEQVKDLLKRDEIREQHLKTVQENVGKFEENFRKEWIQKEEEYLREIEEKDRQILNLKSIIIGLKTKQEEGDKNKAQ